MYGEHGVEMINDNIISRHTAFSSEKMAESYAGASNQNILHNWDFRNPVNQLGRLKYTQQGYSIDRWFIAATTEMTLIPTGILIHDIVGTTHIDQLIEYPHLYHGKTLTASIEIDGVIYSHTVNNVDINVNTVHFMTLPNGLRFGLRTGIGNTPSLRFRLFQSSPLSLGKSYTITRAKLELGTVSTLANDPPMDFGRELAICQRYQQVISNVRLGFSYVAINQRAASTFPIHITPMRITPAVRLSNPVIRHLSTLAVFTNDINFAPHFMTNNNSIILSPTGSGIPVGLSNNTHTLLVDSLFLDANL